MLPVLLGALYGAIAASILWAVLIGNPAHEAAQNIAEPFQQIDCALGGE